MYNKFLTCLFLILGCCVGLDAQYSVLKHFSVEDGLPGDLVYLSYQDSKNNIWSGTDRGVTKYNGHEFRLFTLEDGLVSNDVWGLSEDESGKIWLNTFGKLSYIYNDKVYTREFPFSDTVNVEMVFHFIVNHGHYVKTTGDVRYYLKINNDSVEILNQKDFFATSSHFILKESPTSEHLFASDRSRLKLAQGDSLFASNNFIYVDHRAEVFNLIDSIYNNGYAAHLGISQDSFIICSKDKIWMYENKKLRILPKSFFIDETDNSDIVSVDQISPELICFQTMNNFYLFDKHLKQVHDYDFDKNLEINTLIEDHQNNLWISTRQGLFFFNNRARQSKTFNRADFLLGQNLDFISMDSEDELWGISVEGYLFHLKDKKDLIKVTSEPVSPSVVKLKFDKDDNLWVVGREMYMIPSAIIKKYYKSGVLSINEIEAFSQQTNNKSWKSRNDKIYYTNSAWLRCLDLERDTFKNIYHGRYNGLDITGDGKIWISGHSGLKLLSSEGERIDITNRIDSSLISQPINTLALSGKDELWFSVHSHSLYCFDGETTRQIREMDGYNIQHLYFDENDDLWLATNKGIANLSFHVSHREDYSIRWYTNSDGLASNDVFDLIVKDDQLYAGTTNGLSILKLNQEKPIKANDPQIKINSFSVNGVDTTISTSYVLESDQNNIHIRFSSFDFAGDGDNAFEVKMEGIDSTWNRNTTYSKEYNNLPHGNYIFKVKESSSMESVKMIEIKIKRPWHKSPYSYFLFSFLFLGLSYFILKTRIRKVKRKAEEEVKLQQRFAELELNALQSQINPHFIFNALNAIQEFIFKKKERIANKYIVKFSKLMRLYLESSKEKYILLSDELQLLELYVELEKMRFGDKFDYVFDYEKSISMSMFKIPSMLLQPFVENAINHGLIQRKTEGTLKLNFKLEGDFLTCVIEDDGIGRERSLEIYKNNTHGYKSRGMQLVKERQKVWNIIGKKNVNYEVIDLKDQNGQPCGTRVVVIIEIKD